jgi:hypothetical protein
MENAMRIASHLLIWSLLTVGVLVPTVLLKPVSWRYATALGDAVLANPPSFVLAGVPFVVRDGYATVLCISSRSGRPLPPFVVPAGQYSVVTVAGANGDVHAGVPFVVRDTNGWQVCVSTRGGQSFPPFIAP